MTFRNVEALRLELAETAAEASRLFDQWYDRMEVAVDEESWELIQSRLAYYNEVVEYCRVLLWMLAR